MSFRSLAVRAAAPVFAFVTLAAVAEAAVNPEWVTRVPANTALTAGLSGIVVDADGVTYLTGITGLSPHTDVTTAAINLDGSVRWSRTWNGPEDGGDQARGLALGPGGVLYVIGNTPGPDSRARVVLLKYATATGSLLDVTDYTSGAGFSEHGQSVAVDAAGRVYVAGGTIGDGGDTLVLSFEADGALRWQRSWDGPALAPYSQDTGLKILVGPDGNPVVLMHGVMWSNQPDYVAVKYAAATGDVVWEAHWGGNGGEYPRDMEIDAAGDIYVTGSAIDKYGTVKLRGSDGSLVWQAYDFAAFHNSAAGLALDAQGGVFVTGSVDPDIDRSNSNDDIYTVKRDAAGGAFRWSHRYGAPCLWCFDVPADVVADPAGNVFVAGQTSSPPYSSDAILLVLDTVTGGERDRGTIDGSANELAGFLEMRFDPSWSLRVGGGMYNANTGFVDMTVARYASLVPPPACIYGSRATGCRPLVPAPAPADDVATPVLRLRYR